MQVILTASKMVNVRSGSVRRASASVARAALVLAILALGASRAAGAAAISCKNAEGHPVDWWIALKVGSDPVLRARCTAHCAAHALTRRGCTVPGALRLALWLPGHLPALTVARGRRPCRHRRQSIGAHRPADLRARRLVRHIQVRPRPDASPVCPVSLQQAPRALHMPTCSPLTLTERAAAGSDQPYGVYKEVGGKYHAHAKGVIGYQDGQGFWLVHSNPHFPDNPSEQGAKYTGAPPRRSAACWHPVCAYARLLVKNTRLSAAGIDDCTHPKKSGGAQRCGPNFGQQKCAQPCPGEAASARRVQCTRGLTRDPGWQVRPELPVHHHERQHARDRRERAADHWRHHRRL